MEDARNPSISRAHAILRSLSTGPLGFNALRRELDNPVPATLSRLLKALIAEGLVEQDDSSNQYNCGPALQDLAAAIAPRDRTTTIRQACEKLADACGQSALYCQRETGFDGPVMIRHISAEREGSLAYGPLDKPMFIMAMGFGWPLVAGLDKRSRQRVLKQHAKDSGEPPEQTAEELSLLAQDGILARAEALGSNTYGCTRIVSPAGTTGSLGITVFGQSGRGLSKQQLHAYCDHVREAGLALTRELELFDA